MITITIIMILAGCSSAKNGVDNTSKPNTNNTTNENSSSSSNQQSQLQSKDTQSNNNTTSKLLESIDATKSQFKKGYYEYTGTINNNIPIIMSIYPLEKDIVGTYYYEDHKNVLDLKGKAGEKNIILYEYDETGKNTGIFKGTMSTVEKIEGTWISADNKISYPFELSYAGGVPGAEYGRKYAMFINKSDQDIENFISKIQSYIVNNKKEQLAEEIRYPINVNIDNKVINIQNKEDLIKNYDKIFTVDYTQAISKARTRDPDVTYQGIMIGNGLIWINDKTIDGSESSKLMIIAINN